MVPKAVFNAVTQKKIDATAIAVYGALAMFADVNGKCYPSLARIQQMTDKSESTVRRAIRSLEKASLVSSSQRKGSSNLYYLKRHPVKKSDPFQS